MYAIGAGCLWLRVFLNNNLTKTMGPLIRIVLKMVGAMAVFLILFFLQLIVFSAIASLLFNSTTKYNGFYNSVINLFDAIMGNYSYTDFKQDTVGQTTGEVFIIIFMIVNFILILNLLIAILSDVYNDWSPKSLALFLHSILQTRPYS